jgi:aminomethyltransferase
LSRTTPLYDVHASLGASITEFGGWTMPLRYQSEIAEHRAVREQAGLFDLSHMGQITVSGPDSGRMLDYALVSNLATLPVGKAKYTLMCTDGGGILDDLIVYRLNEQRYLLVANASNTDVVRTALEERASGFDTAVHVPNGRALLAVQGPAAATVLGRIADDDISADRYYSIRASSVRGREVFLARTGYTGEDGFEVFCSDADTASLWQAIREAGADDGLVPAGLSCRDTLRLEAGMPLYGHEITLTTSPYAAGLGRVVHLDKSQFIGREALLQASRSTPAVRLVGLVGESQRIPRAGFIVLDPYGRHVGFVTSGTPSPTLGRPIAMAYVDADVAETQDVLHIVVRGSSERAARVELPFYRREKK